MKNILLVLTALFLIFGCDDDSTDPGPEADIGSVESDAGSAPDVLSVDGGQEDAANISDGAAIDQGPQPDLGDSPDDAGPIADMTPSPADTGLADDMGAVPDMGQSVLADMGEVPTDMGAVLPADAAAPDPQPEGLPRGYTMRCPPKMRQPNAAIDEDLLVTDICVVHRPVSLPFVGGMVHNVGQQMYCSVVINRLTLDLANGNQTGNMLMTIRGLVRLGANGQTRNTCIAPGQSAPFMQVVRFRDDDAASRVEQVNFVVQGRIEETQGPLSTVTIDAIEAEATDEDRMRFTGTLRNIGGGAAGVAPFMVTMVGILPDSLVFDYQHASGLDPDAVIPAGETLDFATWVIGADVEHAPLFTTILNWEDVPPPEEAEEEP